MQMISIAVAENGKKVIEEGLRRHTDPNQARVLSVDTQAERVDILVAGAGAVPWSVLARVLVASGEQASVLARQCQPEMVVTYGMDTRDTITPSSMLHDGGMATVQRELVCLGGSVVEPQEIDLTQYQGSLMDKMAQVAALLITSG